MRRELVTQKEVSELLRCSVKTISRKIRCGFIETFKMGNKVLIYAETLNEEYLNAIKPKFLKRGKA
ncbi:excisionase family DNA-binding protein [Flavobacterium sp.]|uniref:excisionase family DNA-binding protein n=1 Tax=Flavobacterium sp. TaxID=239 RepID=UPI00263209FB|nr:excisionase family DNA-binding protein [Flavobacterium sp.]